LEEAKAVAMLAVLVLTSPGYTTRISSRGEADAARLFLLWRVGRADAQVRRFAAFGDVTDLDGVQGGVQGDVAAKRLIGVGTTVGAHHGCESGFEDSALLV
jgi:hypothetical protein